METERIYKIRSSMQSSVEWPSHARDWSKAMVVIGYFWFPPKIDMAENGLSNTDRGACDNTTELAMSLTSDPFGSQRILEVFSCSFTIFKKRLDLFLLFAVIWNLPGAICSVRTEIIIQTLLNYAEANPSLPYRHFALELNLLRLEPYLTPLIGIMMKAAISVAVAVMYIRDNPHAITCLKRVLCNVWSLFCFYLCSTLVYDVVTEIAPSLGTSNTVYLQVLGILIVTAFAASGYVIIAHWFFFVPSVVIEQTGPIGGFKRSLELMSKDWSLVCFTQVCLSLMALLVTSTIMYLQVDGILGALVVKLPLLFLRPFQAITETVVYLNTRDTHEGLNSDVLMGEVNAKSPHQLYVLTGDDVKAESLVAAEAQAAPSRNHDESLPRRQTIVCDPSKL
jgi:hypothetical protein